MLELFRDTGTKVLSEMAHMDGASPWEYDSIALYVREDFRLTNEESIVYLDSFFATEVSMLGEISRKVGLIIRMERSKCFDILLW